MHAIIKRRLLLASAIFLLIPAATLSQKIAGDYEIGLGATYGTGVTDEAEAGLHFSAYYIPVSAFRAGVDATYYLVNDPRYQSPSFYEINFNAGFYLVNREIFRIYLMTGGHYASWRSERPVAGSSPEITEGSDFGFNAGAGVELDYETILFYAEPKVSVSGFDQFAISAGGRLPF